MDVNTVGIRAIYYINHLRFLLLTYADIHHYDSTRKLLCKVVEYAFAPASDFLLKKRQKIDLGGGSVDGFYNPLHLCISQRNIRLAKKLIDRGAVFENEDDIGRTIFYHAVINNFESAVDLLLKKEHVMNNNFESAVDLLLKKVHLRNNNLKLVADLLLEKEQFMNNNFDVYEKAPFLVGSRNISIAERLLNGICSEFLSNISDVSLRNNEQLRRLHNRFLDDGPIAVIEHLLERGGNINSVNEFGSTPLHMAIDCNYPKVIELLVENGADVEQVDKSGKTPFQHALSCRNFEEIKSLFSSKTKVDFENKKSEFPLHFALSEMNIMSVKALIVGGAQLECLSGESQTPLHIAVLRNFQLGVQYLLENGAQVNVQDKWLRTPLHYAVLFKNHTMVQILFLNGADPSINDIDGFTAFHYAVTTTNLEFVEEIVERVDINMSNREGKTPLHLAAEISTDIVKLLLDNGASINMQDATGKTALHLAADQGYYFNDNVNMLIKRGAALDIRDNDNRTPLSIAASQSRETFDSYSKQIIKLKTINFDIDETDEVIAKFMEPCDDSHSYRNECEEEVARMRERKIGNYCLYDVFYKYSDPIFVMKPLMEEAVRSTSLNVEYPIYASLLQVTFENARVRHRLMDCVQMNFTHNTNNPFRVANMPQEVKRHILSFLRDQDIKNLDIFNKNTENEARE